MTVLVVARTATLTSVDGDRLVFVQVSLDEIEHPYFAPQGSSSVPSIHVGEGLADEAGGNGYFAATEARWELRPCAHERGKALAVLSQAPSVAVVAGGASWDDRGAALQRCR